MPVKAIIKSSFYETKYVPEVIILGQTVRIRDWSWAVKVSHGFLTTLHSYNYEGKNNWKVIATGCDLPGDCDGQNNDVILSNIKDNTVAFSRQRFVLPTE